MRNLSFLGKADSVEILLGAAACAECKNTLILVKCKNAVLSAGIMSHVWKGFGGGLVKPALAKIENAFLPAKEITDAERFSGRVGAVRDCFYSLLTEGANIAIVGNRGIGKTSLARQVSNVGAGENAILSKLGINYDAPLDFLTVYFACGSQVKSTEELLERLLTSSSCLAEWVYDIPKAKKIMAQYSPKFSAGLFGVGVELGGSKSSEAEVSPRFRGHNSL